MTKRFDSASAAHSRGATTSSSSRCSAASRFLIGGRVCCGVYRGMLLLRLGDAGAEAALARPHTRPVAFGKPINSMIFVEPAGFADAAALRAWIKRSLALLATLPAKPKSARKRRPVAPPPPRVTRRRAGR